MFRVTQVSRLTVSSPGYGAWRLICLICETHGDFSYICLPCSWPRGFGEGSGGTALTEVPGPMMPALVNESFDLAELCAVSKRCFGSGTGAVASHQYCCSSGTQRIGGGGLPTMRMERCGDGLLGSLWSHSHSSMNTFPPQSRYWGS